MDESKEAKLVLATLCDLVFPSVSYTLVSLFRNSSTMLAYFLTLLLVSIAVATEAAEEIPLLMPGVRPLTEDRYLCHGLKINRSSWFITAFEPSANANHAHHMLMYACEEPGSTEPSWNCGEMGGKDTAKSFPICSGANEILFSWAMGATGFKLPEGVSFNIGQKTTRKYLVLQGHYKNVNYFRKSESAKDHSGFILKGQSQPTPKLAFLHISVTDGFIPAHSTVFMESACEYTQPVTLHPFSFRVHTHKLGESVVGYVIHKGKWTEIGKKSPQDEQMFYPVTNGVTVQTGDTIAARCVMKNTRDHDVHIGPTQNDEMCNFYFMYWLPIEEVVRAMKENNMPTATCMGSGFPKQTWTQTFTKTEIPESASALPDGSIVTESSKFIEKMNRQTAKLDGLLAKIYGQEMSEPVLPNFDLEDEDFNNDFGDNGFEDI